jgi:hypothetical protein
MLSAVRLAMQSGSPSLARRRVAAGAPSLAGVEAQPERSIFAISRSHAPARLHSAREAG